MNNLMKNALRLATFVVGLGLITIPARAQYTGPEAGQKVAFLGDSITFFGGDPGGWVTLVAQALEQNGKKIEVIQAGLPGNKSNDMLGRLNDHVLSRKPDWMTLSCGVNDVWQGANGVPLDQYKQNITSIVDQATAAGIKVVILTPTLIGEDPSSPSNLKLDTYIDFLRVLATERHLLLIDLNADMKAALAEAKDKYPNVKGTLLTKDGVHPDGPGNIMMAAGVLKGFGFTDAQLAKIKESWLDQPGGFPLRVVQPLTVGQYVQLRAMAAEQGHTIEEMLAEDLVKDVQDRLSAPPPSAPAKP
jgi:lysophospholipase L1-like esterase